MGARRLPPFNLLYKDDAPAAIVDWDRLGVQPRAEEAVRAAAIFFVRPDGALDLPKVRAYAHAYRRTAQAEPAELAAAVHRVWWERLNDFWMLRWHYERGDSRADPSSPRRPRSPCGGRGSTTPCARRSRRTPPRRTAVGRKRHARVDPLFDAPPGGPIKGRTRA